MLHADDAEESLNDHDDGSIKENFREQDIYLPIANVARIMKNAVPQTGKVRSSMCCCHCRLLDQPQAAGGITLSVFSLHTSLSGLCSVCSPRDALGDSQLLFLDRQRRKGVCSRVCERIHQFHNVGGKRALPPGEKEDHQRGGHPVRHVHAGLRHVRGAAEALPAEIPRGNSVCACVCALVCVRERVKRNNMDDVVRFSVFWLFFQAMKGEKGIPGVSVGDSLAEELTDDSFSKNSGFHTFIYSCLS